MPATNQGPIPLNIFDRILFTCYLNPSCAADGIGNGHSTASYINTMYLGKLVDQRIVADMIFDLKTTFYVHFYAEQNHGAKFATYLPRGSCRLYDVKFLCQLGQKRFAVSVPDIETILSREDQLPIRAIFGKSLL